MNKIKNIIQEEVKLHKEEIKRHNEIYSKNKSRRQKEKIIKHHHKLFQTIKIAKKMGFKFCESCGAIE